MDDDDWLAERFEEHRAHLRAVAYRMLGSLSDADDAVQEAWLRLSRSDTSGVENLGGWLTTIVARVSLNMLQSRNARREEPVGSRLPEEAGTGGNGHGADGAGPEHEAVLADSIGLALLVVLDTLTPAERLAFVLHDMFAVPFEEIARIVERTPAATRKLASRARRRVQGTPTAADTDLTRRREIVAAFLAASRDGDLGALVAALDPDVVLRADGAAVRLGAEAEVRGVAAVAGFFSGRAQAARLALVNGVAGAVWAAGGRPRVVFGFTITGGKVTAIDLLAEPALLRELDLVILPN
jgi:RNA polymerase sigma factor (sigma-70 family)